MTVKTPRIGDRVIIQRDETLYPPKGTWPQFAGRTGTVVEINSHTNPALTEYGVAFGNTYPREDRPGVYRSDGPVTWFKDYEMAGAAPEINQDAPK